MGYFGGAGGKPAEPAGSDRQIQFNDDGEIGADPGLLYDKTGKTLVVDKFEVRTPGSTPGAESVLAGQSLVTTQNNNVLLGRNLTLNTSNCVIVVNGGAAPTGQDAIVVGRPNLAGGTKSLHIGRLGGCTGPQGVSVGYDAQCTHQGAMALGHEARSTASGRATFGRPENTMEVEATSHVRARGALVTSLNQAPDPAQLTNGEVAIWFDAVGAALRLLAKTADGTVISGIIQTSVTP